MKPVILLDCDGPLTDGFFDMFCFELREMGYAHVQPHLITSWEISKSFPEVDPAHITEGYRRMRQAGTCASFYPNEGAREFVENIRRWATVLAVTAPLNGSPTWAQEREVWLVDNLGFKVEEIISARDKTHVFGHVLVDDKLSTIEAWQKRWPESEAILWTGAHNVRHGWHPRAGDYFELLGLLAPLRERCR